MYIPIAYPIMASKMPENKIIEEKFVDFWDNSGPYMEACITHVFKSNPKLLNKAENIVSYIQNFTKRSKSTVKNYLRLQKIIFLGRKN